jgi:hypothetical protein
MEKNEEKVRKWREERLEEKRLWREAMAARKGSNQNEGGKGNISFLKCSILNI